MNKVVVGMIGSGFAADLHAKSYPFIYGVDVVLKAVASVTSDVEDFAKKFGFQEVYTDYKEMLKDPEIDVVDIITPPCFHTQMVLDVLQSGKHVICEKPLTGSFGAADADPDCAATSLTKAQMLAEVKAELALIQQAVADSNKRFMYAENFIYAPTVQKSAELIQAEKSRILFMRGEESHSGSHAAHAWRWKYNGGGAFIRQGSHPLAAVLYLKQQEAIAHGEPMPRVTSVLADAGVVANRLNEQEHQHIFSHPLDVEDIANVILTFADGSKALVMAGDMVVGGVRNLVEIYTNTSVHHCNIAPNDTFKTYHEDDSTLEQVYFTEKIGTKKGWQSVFLEEERMRGYIGELQDFMMCVATDCEPQANLDLACQVTELIYAAYQSVEEGRRIDL